MGQRPKIRGFGIPFFRNFKPGNFPRLKPQSITGKRATRNPKPLALNNHRHSHAATDAHGYETGAVILAAHLVHSGDHLTGTGTANGVPQGDSAAKFVGTVIVEAEFP